MPYITQVGDTLHLSPSSDYDESLQKLEVEPGFIWCPNVRQWDRILSYIFWQSIRDWPRTSLNYCHKSCSKEWPRELMTMKSRGNRAFDQQGFIFGASANATSDSFYFVVTCPTCLIVEYYSVAFLTWHARPCMSLVSLLQISAEICEEYPLLSLIIIIIIIINNHHHYYHYHHHHQHHHYIIIIIVIVKIIVIIIVLLLLLLLLLVYISHPCACVFNPGSLTEQILQSFLWRPVILGTAISLSCQAVQDLCISESGSQPYHIPAKPQLYVEICGIYIPQLWNIPDEPLIRCTHKGDPWSARCFSHSYEVGDIISGGFLRSVPIGCILNHF